MITLDIEGTMVEVDDKFLDLSEEERNATVDEIADALRIRPAGRRNTFMGQVNRGIAEGVGGAVDFINPLDNLGITGSARDGLTSAMRGIGADVAQDDPEGLIEAAGRGVGQAASFLLPGAAGARAGSNALRGGSQVASDAVRSGRAVLNRQGQSVASRVADDAAASVAGVGGAASEVAAGGVAGAASEEAEARGYGEAAQTAIGALAPLGAAATVTGAAQAGGFVARNSPIGGTVMRAAAPFTRAGGRRLAQDRVQDLAGGRERAARLAQTLDEDAELDLTPAQRTGDRNLLALQRLAGDRDPEIRERLEQRQAGVTREAREIVEGDGDAAATQKFMRGRQREFTDRLRGNVAEAEARATAAAGRAGPQRSQSENSARVAKEIDTAYARAREEERELWGRVPMDEEVGTDNAQTAMRRLLDETPQAQRQNIPRVARELLGTNSGLGDRTTIREMRGLQAELGDEARRAMAGENASPARARMARILADAVAEDLSSLSGSTPAGRAILEANAFTRAKHEAFDTGLPQVARTRNQSGADRTDPRMVLDSTVGRGGTRGMVEVERMRGAAGFEGGETDAVDDAAADYLRGMFQRSSRDGEGGYTRGSAARFIRDNREMLDQFPGLSDELMEASRTASSAEDMARRAERWIKASRRRSRSSIEGFLGRSPQNAARSIFEDARPGRAARSLLNTAQRDQSGEAVAGLKTAIGQNLILRGMGNGSANRNGLTALLDDRDVTAVVDQVFSPGEVQRLRRVARELAAADIDTVSPQVGTNLSGSIVHTGLDTLGRFLGARAGAKIGGASMAGGLQSAQIFSARGRDLARRLTPDHASEIIARAVTSDPKLLRELLTELDTPQKWDAFTARIAPYIIGGTAGAVQADDEE